MSDDTALRAPQGIARHEWDEPGWCLGGAPADDPDDPMKPGEAELMLEELMHRVNNELASLIGVATREALQASDAVSRAALQRLQSRLVSIGRVHRALQPWKSTGKVDAGQYLRELCDALRQGLPGNVTLDFSASFCPLDAQRCWRLGMVIAELISNAQRHGIGQGGGTVRLELVSHAGRVRCRVSDDGVGSADLVPGRGLKIIGALVRGLQGRMQHASLGAGTTWTITMPL